MKLFSFQNPDKTTAQLERYRQTLMSAETELNAAGDRLRNAHVESANDLESDSVATVTEAQRAWDRAKEKHLIVAGMVKAVEIVHAQALAAAAKKAVAEKWRECELLADRRLALAEKVRSHAEAFVKSYEELAELGLELFKALPVQPGTYADTELSPVRVLSHTRLELDYLGWPKRTNELKYPVLIEKTKEAHAWALMRKEKIES
jgi:hypothetical protein